MATLPPGVDGEGRTRTGQAPGVLTQEMDGEVLLLAPGSVDALHLDEVASTVWRILAERPTFDELVETLSTAYGVSASVIAGDVRPVLEMLEAHGAAVRFSDT